LLRPEYDGLRVQGELFGRQLQAAGVMTRTIRYNGVGHAFIDVVGLLPQAEAWLMKSLPSSKHDHPQRLSATKNTSKEI